MDFSEFSRIKETSGTRVVNEHLELGWKLIFVGQFSIDNESYISYTIGWPAVKGVPVEPKECTK
ncbi:MAG: hypothetical protein SOR71_08025 [Oscillospiraceae bacterium]|nr:hypothetical protein [Clostridium sp.]MDY2989543.1 hypothetical protein [Oscillospiraceae bacterium]